MCAKPLLMFLGQDEATAEAARTYVLTILPGLFAMTQFETVRRYLQGMTIFYLTMYIQCVTMMLHILWSYLLVFRTDLGITGAAISTCITYWLNLGIVTAFITFKGDVVPAESWHMFNADSFKGWWEYLKYGVPSALMLCLEWWCFEILALYAGFLSINELAANVILFNLISFLFQIPLGMSFAISNLAGNSMGERRPKRAKKYFISSLYVIFFLIITLDTLLICYRNRIPLIYTQQDEVIQIVSNTLPVFCFMIFFDYIQGSESGSVRAIGYQDYGSIASLVGYWVFALPISYYLAFSFELRLVGIWLGVMVGTMITAISNTILLIAADWEEMADSVYDRIQKEKSELNRPLLDKED